METIRRILVATDFSDGSRAALEYAVLLAKRFQASVDLQHAWQAPILGLRSTSVFPAELTEELFRVAGAELEKWKADLRKQVPDANTILERSSDPATAILDRSKDYDLIVMGTHGRTGIARWAMGSVAERVVRLAGCPVLTIRASRPLTP